MPRNLGDPLMSARLTWRRLARLSGRNDARCTGCHGICGTRATRCHRQRQWVPTDEARATPGPQLQRRSARWNDHRPTGMDGPNIESPFNESFADNCRDGSPCHRPARRWRRPTAVMANQRSLPPESHGDRTTHQGDRSFQRLWRQSL